ncbi:prenyltransferase/squalene oxidase repeat-containing protein [Granulicella arctica]|uniref:hypothetical protein n=1 Tax=Granulicella arctica TaxID=940613 RepID=UPI0021E0BA32|nr:hypothetical protein [Granulicella arctica]
MIIKRLTFCLALLSTTSVLAQLGNPFITASASMPADWDRQAAAKYMDGRQGWWMTWPKAQRDHGTACVSCHTAVPYALSRPALRHALGEAQPTETERTMLGYITKRVDLWDEVEPFYKDNPNGPTKSTESRATEAVLNAVILASYDARQSKLQDVTKKAFNDAWALQLTSGESKGAWIWLNFHNGPWESNESQYWGATLAAVGVGLAPDQYSSDPSIAKNLMLLRTYLTANYDKQPLINQIGLLWASARYPGLLNKLQREQLTEKIFACQAPDGGWSLTALAPWKRRDSTPLATSSDGYATGLVIYALEQAGLAHKRPQVRRAVTWLRQNQDHASGQWLAYSVNKQRDLSTDVGRFMSDAATGYAVMALEKADK